MRHDSNLGGQINIANKRRKSQEKISRVVRFFTVFKNPIANPRTGKATPCPWKSVTQPRWTELTLNQPPRNVLDREMLTALVDALDELAAGKAPLLLIKANGKHFSTGYSIKDIPEEIFHRDPEFARPTPSKN